jgi:lipopolysaccharide/colanic/teichoic acid biosynthesis glycosyltransferase
VGVEARAVVGESSASPRAGLNRLVDVVGAVALLVASLPLLVVGVVLVAVTNGRPIFFGHQRVGMGGQPFRCWKLRTMKVDAEKALDRDPALMERYKANGFKLPNGSDPRISPVGRLLRRTYIDEIPQLVNVLAGDMSLVGPRPVVPAELDLFEDGARVLLEVKPGVFGAWNSLGRARPPYPERARLEVEYVRDRSFARDVRILGRSVLAVLQGQGEV